MEMLKQQRIFSSSMKLPSARSFLVLSLTLAICCFLVILSFCFIWVVRYSSATQFEQTHHFFLHFNPLFDVNTSTRISTSSSGSGLINFGSEKDANFSQPPTAEASEEEEISKVVQEQSNNSNSNATLFDSKRSALVVNHSVSVNQTGMVQNYPTLSKKKEKDDSNEVEENGSYTGIGGGEGCDLTKGEWVFDERYPLYTNNTCPYIDEGFNCVGNGRLDKDYMKWRWQPQDCNLPSFNATKMLESIRGKRLVFVGDSLNRNQWESMLCLLMGAIKDPKKVYETRGRRITKDKGVYSFRFVDYKCTVEFYVTHFLVHESKARLGKKRLQTLRIDTIDKGSSRWRGADVLVFNTAHWWSHHKTKAGINYFQEGNQIHPHLDGMVAFKRALTTWGSWVDKYVNPRKTRVFFRTFAPSHFSGGEWDSGGHCREAFKPTNVTTGNFFPEKNGIVEEVVSHMRTPVTLLRISEMSGYRRDGHPSIYGSKSVKRGVQDCSHWCLPGVPDTWNELLYYHILTFKNLISNELNLA